MTPKECAVDGCDRLMFGRGWCARHYKRWQRTGNPGPPGPLPKGRPRLGPEMCTVEGCERSASARGWCNKHYVRALRYGDPLEPSHVPGPSPCSVDECTREAARRGWCRVHFDRVQRTGEPGPASIEARPWAARGECGADDCTRETYAKGLCRAHWAAARRRRTPRRPEEQRECLESGCTRMVSVRSRGWCHNHYVTALYRGDIPGPECVEPGCHLRQVSNRQCRKHYEAGRRARGVAEREAA